MKRVLLLLSICFLIVAFLIALHQELETAFSWNWWDLFSQKVNHEDLAMLSLWGAVWCLLLRKSELLEMRNNG